MKAKVFATMPATLPPDVSVGDFDHEDGKFSRIIIEAAKEQVGGDDMLVFKAQAYELDSNGRIMQAPLGYPSRTGSTKHTVSMSTFGKTVNLADSWVVSLLPHNPVDNPTRPVVATKPTAPGTKYGDTVYVTSESKVYQWAEGLVSVVQKAKIKELQEVLATSNARSGFAFR
ncbi:MAG: hypothetical protein WKF61_04015 [Luteimonas sp.]